MKLNELYVVENDVDDDEEWAQRDKRLDELINKTKDIAEHKFGIKGSYGAWRAFLTGGDADDFEELTNELINHGYDEEATSYEENAEFWRSIGVSKAEMDEMILF